MAKRIIIATIITLTIVMSAVLALMAIMNVQTPNPVTDQSTSYNITLERGPCFGFCPAYKLTIDPEGNVSFFGDRFTTGDYNSKIDQEQLHKLHTQLKSINVFQYQDEQVDQRISDLPSIRLTVSDGLNQKSINLYGLVDTLPSALIEFTNQIDDVVNTKQWFAAAA